MITPQMIVDELHKADKDLGDLYVQFAWFKGQRDYWKDRLELALARAKVLDDGPVTKSKEAALVAVSDNFQYLVEIPWLDGVVVNLIEMVRVVSASFDLIDKAYDRMEKHITLLQTVNKNIMMDFQRPST